LEKAEEHLDEKYSPRERIWRILEHQEPDRVSAELGWGEVGITKQAYFNLKHFLHLPVILGYEIDYYPAKASYSAWWSSPVEERIFRRFRIDFRPVSLALSRPFVAKKFYPDDTYVDEFGIHRKVTETYLDLVAPYALEYAETVEQVKEDPYWPDPEKDWSVEGQRKLAREIEEADYAVSCCPGLPGGIFEYGMYRRGFTKLIEDMVLRPKIAEAVLDKILDIYLVLFRRTLDEIGDYCAIVITGDDLGSQRRGLINLDLYRRFVKPREKVLFDLIHSKTKGKLYFHSCGNIDVYIPDLIEIGVDVLNPVQPECPDMHLEDLKKKYGDKLVFCGGLGSQHIIPRGSIDDIYAEVKRAIKAGASGGGYIAGPGHTIQPDVSPWNICAVYDAILRYGHYPLNL
jgi:uroporphyrinogen decarboxylase